MKIKQLNLVLILTLLFSACTKEKNFTVEDPFITNVKHYTKTHLAEG